ncbi:hypothetical protein GQX73_g10768 [Xylaria multiplex]|uniref:NTF2 domain-containing protein n=1 Tax=Xylaria multiplex TaxID=323545 RepID=A0A7C8IJL6_9PEZI|nr:hypothetical protein GQX73_g10768 [Xylaria multiplex]
MATTGPTTHSDQYQPSTTPASTEPTASADQANSNLGKDEVAWFFVEQYYTTLSKTPEKLHLFYGKRSQFVYGQEGQSANVSVGRQNIQDRIKDLDFQNCKVRVSNVDSQASYESIVIQVIGETSNKAGDPKKFVQTFVLAQQPSGYFVLNDILRFIDEEGEEEPAEQVEPEAEAVEAEAPPTALVFEETKESETAEDQSVKDQPTSFDADVVDKKLEEVSATPQEAASVNGEAVPESAADESAAPSEAPTKPADETVLDPDTAAQELAEETVQEPEKPKDPTTTPVASRQPVAPVAAPAAPAPARPPKPMTWASRIAAAAGPPKVSPAMPLTKAAPVAAPTRSAATAAAPTATPQATAPGTQATETTAPAKEAGAEWQTAGGDSKRQNRPQSISGPPAEKEGTLGYVKYVTDKVVREELEAALAQYGELAYFDINRQKNCAFVEFKTPAGYQAAVAANPHVVNGESIVVEPRRPKAGAYGGSNYNAGRGNVHNRGGRGGFDAGRSGSHGSRGSFGGQTRGRGGLPRGRGASQAINV